MDGGRARFRKKGVTPRKRKVLGEKKKTDARVGMFLVRGVKEGPLTTIKEFK